MSNSKNSRVSMTFFIFLSCGFRHSSCEAPLNQPPGICWFVLEIKYGSKGYILLYSDQVGFNMHACCPRILQTNQC
ncbi:hypothetical protein Hanom_Chr15g01359121 [Helianthus anomalus]